MRLVAFSDLHGAMARLPDMLRQAGPADVVVLPGDLTDFGTPGEAEEVLDVCLATGAEVLAVAGNCDGEAIEERLKVRGVSVSGRGAMVGDVGFFGAAAGTVHNGRTWEVEEAVLGNWIEAGYRQVRDASRLVMVCHVPPLELVDASSRGVAVGSSAVRHAIEQIEPALMLCGHIHEARGHVMFGNTTVVNCGPARQGYFAVIDLADQVDVCLCKAGQVL